MARWFRVDIDRGDHVDGAIEAFVALGIVDNHRLAVDGAPTGEAIFQLERNLPKEPERYAFGRLGVEFAQVLADGKESSALRLKRCACAIENEGETVGFAGGVVGGETAAPKVVGKGDGGLVDPKAGATLLPGGMIEMHTAGGAGYGLKSERDPSLVRRDIELGYVTNGADPEGGA